MNPRPARADSAAVADLHRVLVELAETNPGIVAKLSLLWGDIEAGSLPAHTLRTLAETLRLIAGALDAHVGPPDPRAEALEG